MAGKLRIRWARVIALAALVAVAIAIVAWRADDEPVPPRNWRAAACRVPHRWVELMVRGWYDADHGLNDLILFREPPANHSGPQEVLQSVPLVFYGPGLIEPGEVSVDREVTLADVAATTGELIGLEGARFPDARPIDQVIPDGDRPALVITVVMDGGGLNTLARWPEAHPNIDRIFDGGAPIDEAKVGSSPSVTTAVHATLSTGVFPNRHGITGLFQRDAEGNVVPAFSRKEFSPQYQAHPENPKAPTVADLWDVQTDNAAQIGYVASFNYPLGMVGHGSAFPGGDKDIVAIGAKAEWHTPKTYYSMPDYMHGLSGMDALVERLDRSDGKDDGKWMGSDRAFSRLDVLPVFPEWQNRGLLALLEREGFGKDEVADLMYVNYKPMDLAAHFWSIASPGMEAAVEGVDGALGELVGWLETNLPGRFVLILTADHGGIPLRTDAFPYLAETVLERVQQELDTVDNDTPIIERETPTAFFLDEEELARNDLTAEDVANFLQTLTVADGNPPERDVSSAFQGEMTDPLFQAVVPARRLDEVFRCTEGNPEP